MTAEYKTLLVDGPRAIVLFGGRLWEVKEGCPEPLTVHPKTGKLVRGSIHWPDDYPPKEVAGNLRSWYGQSEARSRAIILGAWEAAMLLEEVRP